MSNAERADDPVVFGSQKTPCGRCDLVYTVNRKRESDCHQFRPGGGCHDARLISEWSSATRWSSCGAEGPYYRACQTLAEERIRDAGPDETRSRRTLPLSCSASLMVPT